MSRIYSLWTKTILFRPVLKRVATPGREAPPEVKSHM